MADPTAPGFVALDQLLPVLKALRDQGISEFAARPDGGWCVKFTERPQAPAAEVSEEQIKALRSVLEPETCKCGHPEYQHSNGLCIAGCEPQKCAPAEDDPAEEDNVIERA